MAKSDPQLFLADPFVAGLINGPSHWLKGANVVVAHSGGPDSTALLLFCVALKCAGRLGELRAVHINHGLRGAESDGDEEFCRSLADDLNVAFVSERLDGTQYAEEALRDARYEILCKWAKQHDAVIATGHTQDDQAETVLFRLFRGTGLDGLAGMSECGRTASGVELIRPLLPVSKQDCLSFLQRVNVVAREDRSNNESAYSRNFIRRELLPLIEDRFPGASQRIARAARSLKDDRDLIADVVETALRTSVLSDDPNDWNRPAFLSMPQALRRRLVLNTLRQLELPISFEQCTKLVEFIERGSGELSLSSRVRLAVACDHIYWRMVRPEATAENDGDSTFVVALPGQTNAPSLRCCIHAEEIHSAEEFASPDCKQVAVDLSNALQPLVVRRRLPGDMIQPFGMREMVRLKKFIRTHKPKHALEGSFTDAVVLADENEVLWVPGVGISEKLRVTDRPTHRLTFMKLPR